MIISKYSRRGNPKFTDRAYDGPMPRDSQILKTARQRLTFANVMSVIAVFVALGGTSVAAISLKRNSVKGKHIARNAITSPKVKDASLLARDFAAGQLLKGDKGDKGDRGEKGDKGDTGDPSAFTITSRFEQAAADLANGANGSYDVYCPAGQRGVAGGGRGDDTLSEETIITNTRPARSSTNTEPPADGGTFTGWRITVVNPAGGAASGIKPEVWVVCITP
jgi:hypothetical protein